MRILVVSQQFWPENFRINDLTAELVKRGHEVTVLTGVPNYPEGKVFEQYRMTPERYAQYEGVKIVRVPIIVRGTRKFSLMLNYVSYALSASLLGPYKLRHQKFDVIFTYEPSPVTVGIPAAVLRRIKRAPMAFWVLDLWPETLSAVGAVRSPMILKMVGLLVKAIYKNCDLILAQSKSFVSQIRRYAGADSRVEYFPSWSEVEFEAGEVLAATEVKVVPKTFNVMFAGNIGVAQDFPSILTAVQNLKQQSHIKWHIVGDGRMGQWVNSFVQEHGLQENIALYGRYPLERMPSFFKHADALLVSLKDDPIFAMTIPGKLQTYLSAGIPVIAMLNGEGADLIKSSGAGLTCAAGDADGLTRAILHMAEMPETARRAMGERGKEVMAREFDRTRLINALELWLSDMCLRTPER
jgi:colanic acid biosynthesis glycosyl transferase WcaI